MFSSCAANNNEKIKSNGITFQAMVDRYGQWGVNAIVSALERTEGFTDGATLDMESRWDRVMQECWPSALP